MTYFRVILTIFRPFFDHFLDPFFRLTHIGGLLNLNKPVKDDDPKMTTF